MYKIHRGWFVLVLIMLSILACLGLGRFAFGAIIPFMKEGLDLTYREVGLIASAIFLGYMASAAGSGYAVIYFSSKKVIVTSLLIIALSMFLIANASHFWIVYLGCLWMGIGSGGANIPSLGLVAQWFRSEQRGAAMGLATGGIGLGIVLSGLLVPQIVTGSADEGWRMSWIVLSAAVFIVAIMNLLFLKNHPSEVGLQPIGERPASTMKTIHTVDTHQAAPNMDKVYTNKTIWMLGIIYFLWGFSYLVFSTFLVDFLMSDKGFDEHRAGQFFAAAGFTSIVSGWLWGYLSDRWGRLFALSALYFSQFILLVLFCVSHLTSLLFLETILYGAVLFGVPTVMVASVSDFVGAKSTPIAMGFITLFFGAGQFVSPVVTGYILDSFNSYIIAFLVSACILLVGGVCCIRMHIASKSAKVMQ